MAAWLGSPPVGRGFSEPRWPLLNKWSSKTAMPSLPVENLRVEANIAVVASDLSPPSKSQSTSCNQSIHETLGTVEKDTPAKCITEPKMSYMSFSKGALEKPLPLLSPPL